MSKNATAYNAYFNWKQYIVPLDHKYMVYCDICIKLHLETVFGIEPKRFDMQKYWNIEKQCLVPAFNFSLSEDLKFVPANITNRINKPIVVKAKKSP